ncbi:hypothetical protein LSTR_LSTR006389 [Laodelphax striatellus]|uniref:Uncharacterized protein n=1 Tax=Laodelphax striatellus TaxID=195883 RepID=A0A482WY68_LAOST|nr:hypothetical protein LSTR_LSTR006389 [Laodelphax striatellus]
MTNEVRNSSSDKNNPATATSDVNSDNTNVNLSKDSQAVNDKIEVTTAVGIKDDNITPRVTQSTISDEKASSVSSNNTDTDTKRVIANVPINCPKNKVYDHDIKRCVTLA